MTKPVKLRDPIHGFIELEGREIDLVNLPLFQRLRRIRQLAFANLVYPGALHTRFDHSIGVLHLSKQMANALRLNTDERQIIRFAALLHDIGHGPFSHVSEILLERYALREKVPAAMKNEKIHEIITGHLIREHAPLIHILGKQQCNQIADLLSIGFGEPALKSIISGPLDADKQDYLLRDSYFCGVRYGVFDFHQLQRSIKIAGNTSARELMIAPGSVHAVEQFILAKYYMTTMVYRHKVRLITDQMIIRAIILGIEVDEIEELKRLYYFDNSESFCSNYLKWDDTKFLMKFGEEGKGGHKSKELIDRLTDRRLLKRVFSVPIKEFSAEVRERLRDITKVPNVLVRKNIEKEIASVLQGVFKTSVDPDLTILHAYEIKSVRESARNDETGILVYNEQMLHSNLEEESTLLQSIDEKLSERYVEVYAPLVWDTHSSREKVLGEIKKLIQGVIQSTITATEGKL